MASLRGDIVNRVRRLPKPSGPAEALQPIFEALSNSLHAVEEIFGGEDYVNKGNIAITINSIDDPGKMEVVIVDNGIGLSDDRYEAFCTTDTGYKMKRGGKGVGRLLWLDAFEEISVKSVYAKESKKLSRSFQFKLDNENQIADEKNAPVNDSASCGTEISLRKLRAGSYRDKFPKNKEKIKSHLGSHFFADFISGKSPKITLNIDGEATAFPSAIADLKIETRPEADIITDDFGSLKISNFICDKKASISFDGLHQMHLIANGRTVLTRKIDGLLGIKGFGPDKDHIYHGCISGDFLDERVNQERTQFNITDTTIKEIVKCCAEHARENALSNEIEAFDAMRLESLNDFVSEYPSFGFEEAESLLERTPKKAAAPEEFAKALIPYRIRRDKDRNARIQEIVSKIGSDAEGTEDFVASIKEAANQVKSEEQRQLTEYVLRRKSVLDVMDVLIARLKRSTEGADDDHFLEETLHQFICPMKIRGDDPTKVEESDHDLWIIDERLTFTKYFASDVPLSQIIVGSDDPQRPDIFVYNGLHGLHGGGAEAEPLRRVMLVEFKRPGKTQYSERYTPYSQVMEYLERLKNGTIENMHGMPVRIADDCVYHCYIIANIVGKLKTQVSGWPRTSTEKGRIFHLEGDYRGTIEVIEWVDLLHDAKLRNNAFLQAAGLAYKRPI